MSSSLPPGSLLPTLEFVSRLLIALLDSLLLLLLVVVVLLAGRGRARDWASAWP